jgi:hypothetical protein
VMGEGWFKRPNDDFILHCGLVHIMARPRSSD